MIGPLFDNFLHLTVSGRHSMPTPLRSQEFKDAAIPAPRIRAAFANTFGVMFPALPCARCGIFRGYLCVLS